MYSLGQIREERTLVRNRSKDRLRNLIGLRSDPRLDEIGRHVRQPTMEDEPYRSNTSMSRTTVYRKEPEEVSVDLSQANIKFDNEYSSNLNAQKKEEIGKKLTFENDDRFGTLERDNNFSFQGPVGNKDQGYTDRISTQAKTPTRRDLERQNTSTRSTLKTDPTGLQNSSSSIIGLQRKSLFPHSRIADFDKEKNVIQVSHKIEPERETNYRITPYEQRSIFEDQVLAENKLMGKKPCDYHGKHDTISSTYHPLARSNDNRRATPERADKMNIGGLANRSQRNFDHKTLGGHYKGYSKVKDLSRSIDHIPEEKGLKMPRNGVLSRSYNDMKIMIDDGSAAKVRDEGTSLSQKYRLDRFDRPSKPEALNNSRMSIHTPTRPLKSILKPSTTLKASSSQLNQDSRYAKKPKY